MFRTKYILPILLFAMFLPEFAYSQEVVPFWVRDSWRSKNYPANEWYTCFIQNKGGQKSESVLKKIEREARSELVDSIFLDISDKGKSNYRQMLLSAINSETVQIQSNSYYHPSNEVTYAFAAMKKANLFAYYESMIKSELNEAINTFEQGKQLAEQGKKHKSFDKFAESKKQIESLSNYRDFLEALDSREGPKYSQSENSKNLLKNIDKARAEAEKMKPIYVNGTERISGSNPDIMIPGLYAFFDENGCRTTDDTRDAGYHVRVDTKTCNTKKLIDGFYCQACVSANITNIKTRATVQKINFTSSMAEGDDIENACISAFDMALSELLRKISERALSRICD